MYDDLSKSTGQKSRSQRDITYQREKNAIIEAWEQVVKGQTLWKLENVAIANALQLEAARATPDISRFNYYAMPSLKSLNLLPYYSV